MARSQSLCSQKGEIMARTPKRIVAGAILVAILAALVWLFLRQPDRNAPAAPSATTASTPSASRPQDLSALLRFEDPATCETNETLASIFETLLKWNPASPETGRAVQVPGFAHAIMPTQLRRTNPPETSSETILPLHGEWLGLNVTSLAVDAAEESDNISNEIRFSDPPARVLAALNRHGFDLPVSGDWRPTNPEFGSIGVIDPMAGARFIAVLDTEVLGKLAVSRRDAISPQDRQ